MLLAFTLAIALACQTEDAEVSNSDDDSSAEEELVLVNAFENLSFTQPLDLQSPNDDTNRIFVVEKQGAIKVFLNENNVSETSTFLDLSGNLVTDSEQGLLGLAFHPNYAVNGYFYVYYNPTNSISRISRFTASSAANVADVDSEVVILEIPQTATNHNGGQLVFGADGYLYISSGDGGGNAADAQNLSNLLGTILRIDVDNTSNGFNYSIPGDNPFTNNTEVRNEIFAYGLRNPWRMSFDTQTNALWTGDVGQNAIEEIDIIVSGGNYGWNTLEGSSCYSGDCSDISDFIAPVFEYNQSNGDRSITGGFVYRGTTIPALQGKYVYGDFVSGRVWMMNLDGTSNELIEDTGYNIAAFGTDLNQELYLLDLSGGIYKFTQSQAN
ncbi:glucose dehydrogenase [Croceivirga lutea]|nr:glucose dehydrogenase [Croceivirga lutea]